MSGDDFNQFQNHFSGGQNQYHQQNGYNQHNQQYSQNQHGGFDYSNSGNNNGGNQQGGYFGNMDLSKPPLDNNQDSGYFQPQHQHPPHFEQPQTDPDGYQNLGGTCYLNSTLQLLHPLKDTVFKKGAQKCKSNTCYSCMAFRYVTAVLHGDINIENFVKNLNIMMTEYFLYEWHPSKEFLTKLLRLLMEHNTAQLSKVLLTIHTLQNKKIIKGIQEICRSESISYDIELSQVQGIRYEEFPEYLIVSMNSMKPSSIPEEGVLVKNFNTKKSSVYRFLGCVTGSGQHAYAFSYRQEGKGKGNWYLFNDDKPRKLKTFEQMKRNVCSSKTVVELFILKRFGRQQKIDQKLLKKFSLSLKKHLSSQSQSQQPRQQNQPQRHIQSSPGRMMQQQNRRQQQLKKELEEEEEDTTAIPIYKVRLVVESSFVRLSIPRRSTRRNNQAMMVRSYDPSASKPFTFQITEYRFCPNCGWSNRKMKKDSKFEICVCCEAKVCFNCLKYVKLKSGKYAKKLCDPLGKCKEKRTQQTRVKSQLRIDFEDTAKKMNMGQLQRHRNSLKVKQKKPSMDDFFDEGDNISNKSNQLQKNDFNKNQNVIPPPSRKGGQFGMVKSYPQGGGSRPVHPNQPNLDYRQGGQGGQGGGRGPTSLPVPPERSSVSLNPVGGKQQQQQQKVIDRYVFDVDPEYDYVRTEMNGRVIKKQVSDLSKEDQRIVCQKYYTKCKSEISKLNSLEREAWMILLQQNGTKIIPQKKKIDMDDSSLSNNEIKRLKFESQRLLKQNQEYEKRLQQKNSSSGGGAGNNNKIISDYQNLHFKYNKLVNEYNNLRLLNSTLRQELLKLQGGKLSSQRAKQLQQQEREYRAYSHQQQQQQLQQQKLQEQKQQQQQKKGLLHSVGDRVGGWFGSKSNGDNMK